MSTKDSPSKVYAGNQDLVLSGTQDSGECSQSFCNPSLPQTPILFCAASSGLHLGCYLDYPHFLVGFRSTFWLLAWRLSQTTRDRHALLLHRGIRFHSCYWFRVSLPWRTGTAGNVGLILSGFFPDKWQEGQDMRYLKTTQESRVSNRKNRCGARFHLADHWEKPAGQIFFFKKSLRKR